MRLPILECEEYLSGLFGFMLVVGFIYAEFYITVSRWTISEHIIEMVSFLGVIRHNNAGEILYLMY